VRRLADGVSFDDRLAGLVPLFCLGGAGVGA
jgi:hypothetical protein